MVINMKGAIKIFNEFVKDYDLKDPMISLKYHHSLRVMNFANDIASSLNLSDEDVFLATLCGLLHDVGRFHQWTKYKTFRDHESIDHGDYGYQILKDGLIDKFEINDEEKRIVLSATKLHNKLDNTEEDEKARLIVDITRDADKLDIIDTCGIVNHDEEIILKDKMIEDIITGNLTKNEDVKTDTDMILRYVSWVNDLNFIFSYEYLNNSKVLDNKLHLLEIYGESPNSKKLREYINTKLKEKVGK